MQAQQEDGNDIGSMTMANKRFGALGAGEMTSEKKWNDKNGDYLRTAPASASHFSHPRKNSKLNYLSVIDTAMKTSQLLVQRKWRGN